MDFKSLFFSAEGRLNRLSYFLLAISVGIISTVLTIFINMILQDNITLILIVNGVIDIITFIIAIFLLIKRFHDFNKSGYYLLGFIVIMSVIIAVLCFVSIMTLGDTVGILIAVIIAIAFALYIYLKPGTKGANQYGNQPAALFDLGLDNNVENKNTNPVISDNSSNQ